MFIYIFIFNFNLLLVLPQGLLVVFGNLVKTKFYFDIFANFLKSIITMLIN